MNAQEIILKNVKRMVEFNSVNDDVVMSYAVLGNGYPMLCYNNLEVRFHATSKEILVDVNGYMNKREMGNIYGLLQIIIDEWEFKKRK